LLKELAEVDSTQNLVRELGAEEAPEGTVVVAKRQTAGRGRRGRTWVSPEGGLYMSVLLRPPSSAMLQTLTLASSLAVVQGIKKATELDALISWPNDIMIGGKKVAGVIAESNYAGQKLSFVALGIGVNCNSGVPSEDIWSTATSLADQVGREVDIVLLRQAILEAFVVIHEMWLSGGDVIEAVRRAMGTIGKLVVVKMKSGGELNGFARDIEQTGGLVLELDDRKLVVHAEEVERLKEV
jgi:BirA family biotin operon repressor/biotin-[acetyl-CoA-carboxylase] ligase